MKHYLLLICLMSSSIAYATEAKNAWNATKLTESTIKKIQQAQYQYKKCVTDKMRLAAKGNIDVKDATASIMKLCEEVLAQMRQIYLDNGVPAVIADRHLKKMRNDITRRVIKQLMFTKAADKAGAQ
ncbi:MAG: hypothetical protein HFP77_06140 [Methylococcales symbiont of Iophon sp. n. MRB-2018]|nr:MAG: hypothetical protein HFP77_06140 [Methylococcales symbiont of Iophon sp. n. MRB-2018]KAF3979033.1 MAG: hypothetical protein HFP76_09465 [Methylococcales symbiont of Iophon sp. n. MRB-2018]